MLAPLSKASNGSDASSHPLYYTTREHLLPGIVSDEILVLIVPLVVFWVISISFDILDSYPPASLEKYRIHPSQEEASRNRVSKTQVILTVMLQQLIQTVLGFWWLNGESNIVPEPSKDMLDLQRKLVSYGAIPIMSAFGPKLVPWLYWWGIPVLQFIWAIFIIDTWQYTLHRLMHTYPILYKHLHSWHHRLYVPYAYSSLYNHPIEGLLLDIIGSLLSYDLSRMTPRQGMLLFGIATAKTAHDHCGWSLPFDPFQIFFRNNANYHDIHHQTIGIKHNFSQPFFVHWDTLLGTKMTREEMEMKKAASRAKSGKFT